MQVCLDCGRRHRLPGCVGRDVATNRLSFHAATRVFHYHRDPHKSVMIAVARYRMHCHLQAKIVMDVDPTLSLDTLSQDILRHMAKFLTLADSMALRAVCTTIRMEMDLPTRPKKKSKKHVAVAVEYCTHPGCENFTIRRPNDECRCQLHKRFYLPRCQGSCDMRTPTPRIVSFHGTTHTFLPEACNNHRFPKKGERLCRKCLRANAGAGQ